MLKVKVKLLFVLFFSFSTFSAILHIHPHQNFEILVVKNEESEREEMDFINYLNNLFSFSKENIIDTTGWCTFKINCSNFDYRLLNDTFNIPLVDSSNGRYFTYPLRNYVTSPFGMRGVFWHSGVDIKVNYRDTIRAAFDGIVRIVKNDRYGYGNVVVIRHLYGIETLYGHLSSAKVKVNQRVKSGDLIGLGGRSGRATGRHLHFEIRFCGEPFNPAYVLDYESYSLKNSILKLSKSNFEYLDEIRSAVYHTVMSGENLSFIAKKYRTTVRKLCVLNNITEKTILKIGRKLIIRKEETPEVIISKNKSAEGES